MSDRRDGPFGEEDEAARAAAVAEAKRIARLREVDDFKWLMGHKQGRRFMWRMLSMTGLFRQPHIPGTDDVLFRCGEQNIGQKLLAEIHTVCPEHYPTMTKENT